MCKILRFQNFARYFSHHLKVPLTKQRKIWRLIILILITNKNSFRYLNPKNSTIKKVLNWKDKYKLLLIIDKSKAFRQGKNIFIKMHVIADKHCKEEEVQSSCQKNPKFWSKNMFNFIIIQMLMIYK